MDPIQGSTIRLNAHWRKVANTSTCGGDAVLCQIALTSYLWKILVSQVYTADDEQSLGDRYLSSLSDVCLSVCDIGALWPNGWIGRPRSRSHCVRWGPSTPSPSKGAQQPPALFGPNRRPSQLLLSTCTDCRVNCNTLSNNDFVLLLHEQQLGL